MSDCPNCGEKELLLVEEVYICGACGMEYKDRDIPHATKLHRRIDELTAKFAALREQVKNLQMSELDGGLDNEEEK